MRWIILLSFVPVVLCTDRCFVTNDANLTALPKEGLQTVDNQVAGKFVLKIHQTLPLTYKPNEPIEVTLSTQDMVLRIREFVVVARVPCDTCGDLTPLGEWNLGPSTEFSLAGYCSGESMAYQGRGDAVSANIVWIPPATINTVEFAASVVASDGKVYQHIRSPFIMSYLLTGAGKEEAGVDDDDVHSDPREFEEEDRTHGDDEEGVAGGDWEEEEKEEGPEEDPNEEERYEEEMREESLRRDREGELEDKREDREGGERDDHGARAEEEMRRREEERRRQEIRDEDLASEDSWIRDKLNEMEEEEEEFQNELMEYEKTVAEQERKRMEMIQWEIRDKEEHDRRMAEQERDRDTNKTPKDDYMEPSDEEISVNEQIIDGSAAGTLSTNVALLLMAAILKFVF